MDELGVYDCEMCPNWKRIERMCHVDLQSDFAGDPPVDTRPQDRTSTCLRSLVDHRSGQAAQAASLLSDGALTVHDLDSWYMQAVYHIRAEQGRLQRVRAKARADAGGK